MSDLKTLVGDVHPQVLAFTAGRDAELDRCLIEVDCIGSAAHARMLAALELTPPLLQPEEADSLIETLVEIIRAARRGAFTIRPEDQDVHLAVERALTQALGAPGRRIHTARSRNDQIALDLRLYARDRLLDLTGSICDLATAMLDLAARHRAIPMVGRTHLQPAMPSSVGVWASAHAESLLDDLILIQAVYELNDRCPLGSAAGYGVPLPIDRELTARLLGFAAPVHNVLYASSARGKCEAAILGALGQVMLSLGRLAEDMILFMMPEFGYFSLPPSCCTGSSIMPQKQNPDVFELIRARTTQVLALEQAAAGIVKGLASGYSRDLQEIKPAFLEGLRVTAECVSVLNLVMPELIVHPDALRRGFGPAVFAADRALELVAGGMPFRDAYDDVKANLAALADADPDEAIARKVHAGAPAGLDLDLLRQRARARAEAAVATRQRLEITVSDLLGVRYPDDVVCENPNGET